MYRVLVADDELWMTLSIKKLIEKSGLLFRVIGEVMNGVAALEAVEREKPDLLITDIRMPGYDGLELLEQMKKKCLATKVILLSGYAEFEYARKAIRLDAFDYLLKPVKQEQLESTLQELVRVFEGGEAVSEFDSQEEENLPMIEEIIRNLQQNYRKDITLTSIAKKYNMSTSYLSELLKERIGMSFSEYLISKRIQKAKELLADEKLSINEIGEAVGYKDYYYFMKVFKKVVGITPSKYRKNL